MPSSKWVYGSHFADKEVWAQKIHVTLFVVPQLAHGRVKPGKSIKIRHFGAGTD
jgi:hypothetical protein